MFVHMPYNEAWPDKRSKAARYKQRECQPRRTDSPATLHLPGKTSHERDELIEILRAGPANYRAAYDNKEPENVLLPLDIPV